MQKELEGSFSISALKFAPKIQMEGDYSYLLDDGKQSQESDLREEVEEIEDVILDDSANYKVPESDDGYYTVLKERFGHEEFKEGQLKAVKLILEQKKNALVVLATGGGKSLCYQYVTQFLEGLVLVVTPLISLMTDQLQKLPDFVPGAALNSQQSYATK